MRLNKKSNKVLNDNYMAILDDMKDIQTRIDKYSAEAQKDDKKDNKMKDIAKKTRFQ